MVTLAAIGSRQPDFSPAVRAAAIERPTLEYFRGVATPQAPELVPAQYLLSPRATDPRTLIDILYQTAAAYCDESLSGLWDSWLYSRAVP